MKPINAEQVSELVGLIWDGIGINADLDNIATRLRELAFPGAVSAARSLTSIRQMLSATLTRLDKPVTELVRQWEAENGTSAVEAFDPYEDQPDAPF